MDATAHPRSKAMDALAPTRIAHYINGARVDAADGPTSPVYNPATGAQTGILPLADRAQVDVAVAAAKAAFPAWAQTPPQRRARVMFKLRALLEANADKLASMITEAQLKEQAEGGDEKQCGIEHPPMVGGGAAAIGDGAGATLLPAATPVRCGGRLPVRWAPPSGQ